MTKDRPSSLFLTSLPLRKHLADPGHSSPREMGVCSNYLKNSDKKAHRACQSHPCEQKENPNVLNLIRNVLNCLEDTYTGVDLLQKGKVLLPSRVSLCTYVI